MKPLWRPRSGDGPKVLVYPTRALVLWALAGAPVALLVGVLAPGLWTVGVAWLAALAGAAVLDAVLSPAARDVELTLDSPDYLAVGRPGEAGVRATTERGRLRGLEAALDADGPAGLIEPSIAASPDGVARFLMVPPRRGLVAFQSRWARWKGPLGLMWRQLRRDDRAEVGVGADIRRIENDAVRMFSRDAEFGAKIQRDIGEGAEFHALQEFRSGMDRRTIDWKQSARHWHLLAKEFRTERNHQVVMALDSGRMMSEPVGGAPRIDRAVDGALLLAYVCLRSGDRAGLYAFDDRPRLSTGALTGVGAFPLLHRQAARIDYGTEETNYALGLSTLSAGLRRRSLIVIFTEFADATAAELMLESVGRALRTHLILFVVMRDDELEGMAGHAPETPDDVARAVVATDLMRERTLVLTRLRRMGAHVVEAPADQVGPAALNAYLDLKRKDLL
ncbi:DUF58 domain-containing protein [Brevundimonas sp.]|uniref:DUF58 domain-containing protein n=1 Tax=Brevundimonas sp. TaxID=1871086 RepID=UPI0035B087E5